MILNIGDKIYEAGKLTVKSCIDLAKEKYKKERKNAIVAVIKGDHVFMKNEEHPSQGELNKAIMRYNQEGFLVHYTIFKGGLSRGTDSCVKMR